MRTRLAILVILLVLIPTAVLSILAGRALRHWELVLQRQIQTNARRALGEVTRKFHDHLQEDLDRVRVGVAQCLAGGGRYSDLAEVSQRLVVSQECVADVFVFMNPWGFAFPEEGSEPRRHGDAEDSGEGGSVGRASRPDQSGEVGKTAAPAPESSSHPPPSLTEDIRRAISTSAASGDGLIALESGGDRYCLTVLDPAKALYVGYRINLPGLKRCLAGIMRTGGSGFELEAEGLGFLIAAAPSRVPAPILISDSFSQNQEELPAPPPASARSIAEEALASTELPPPFSGVVLRAFLEDPSGTRRAQAMRIRLSGWGIALLAGAIVTGVWLVLSQAGAEIRRVRARSDFVLGVSHDLRTPLASMKMLAESLHGGRVTEESSKQRFLGTIVQECDRLNNLIERVLFFVRLGQGALVYRFELLDVNRLVKQAVEVASRSAGERVICYRSMVSGEGGQNGRKKAQEAQGGRAPEGGSPPERRPTGEEVGRASRRDQSDEAEVTAAAQPASQRPKPKVMGKTEAPNVTQASACRDRVADTAGRSTLGAGAGQDPAHSFAVRRAGTDEGGSPLERRPTGEEVGRASRRDRSGEVAVREVVVRGDEGALMQVMLNLLDNAVKYGGRKTVDGGRWTVDGGRSGLPSQAGVRGPRSEVGEGIVVEVGVVRRARRGRRFIPSRDWVRVAVTDSGRGMSPEQVARVFRRFYRGPGSTDRNVSGVGLGLTLCRHIVESHGGWIEVSSVEGRGSTFAFFLPA